MSTCSDSPKPPWSKCGQLAEVPLCKGIPAFPVLDTALANLAWKKGRLSKATGIMASTQAVQGRGQGDLMLLDVQEY